MSFVQRELDRIAVKLREVEMNSPLWKELYIAQQALAWALEPDGIASPYNSIMAVEPLPVMELPVKETP